MNTKQISQLQIISIGVCNVLGTIIVSVFTTSVLHNEAWLAGILGFIVRLPTIFIYCILTKKYHGMGLFQINEAVFGNIAGRIISFLYILYFFTVCEINMIEAAVFLSHFLIAGTSQIAIASFILAGCIYCTNKGIAPIARVSTVFMVMMVFVMLFNGLVSLLNANFEYVLPLFSHKLIDYVQDAHIAASIPFGESVALLVLIPDLDRKVSIKKTYVTVSVATVAVIVYTHIREIIVLGPMVIFSALPTYEAARVIHVPGILTRIESLFALTLIMLTFFKTLVMFFVCNIGIKQITRIKSAKHITTILGLLVVAYAVTTFGSPMDNIYYGKNISPFIWSFFSTLLPLITLIAAFARQLVSRVFKRTPAESVSQ